ncbi:MAG: lipase secretion chaperone [Wenzhouxiangellaceae bacterium]
MSYRWLIGAVLTAMVAATVASFVFGTHGGSVVHRDGAFPAMIEHESAIAARPANREPAVGPKRRPQTSARPGSAQQQILLDDQALAPSLSGSDIDGEFNFDSNGELLADTGLRRYFDYFLSTIGEHSLADIRRLLSEQLHRQLPPAEAWRALDYFQRYQDYLAAVEEAQLNLNNTLSPADAFARILDLRESILGEAMNEAFFGTENRYTAMTLAASAELEQASPESRDILDELIDQVDQNDAELQQWLALRAELSAHHQTVQQSSRFQSNQVSPQQRYAQRSEQWGDAAAQRLAALDQQQAQWRQRLLDYRQRRQQLTEQALAPGELNQQLTELRASLFDNHEQRRVQALEALDFPGLDQTAPEIPATD